MKTIASFFIAIILLILFSHGVSASSTGVIINEIQLLPTEARFIELYNPHDSTIDLTGYYIQRKTQTGSDFSSLVSKTYFENKTIGAFGYFLIARENINNADIVIDNLTLTESNTLQIKKSTNEIVDKISWGDYSDYTTDCAPNPENGQSIQRASNGNWITAIPTPKEQNNNHQATDNSQQTTQSTDTQGDDQQPSISSSPAFDFQPPAPSLIANAGENIIALIGQEIIFDASKSQGNISSYEWNFGNGQTAKTSTAKHIYKFPGAYIVTLTASDGVLQSQTQIIASIYPSGVYINEFLPSPSDQDEEWIEVYNSNNFAVDLSGWQLKDSSQSKGFTIPNNTFISSKGYLTLSKDITKISLNNDSDTLRFYYPQNISIEEISYEKAEKGFSAARKLSGEFIWTQNQTPSNLNIFSVGVSSIRQDQPSKSVSVNNTPTKNLTSKNSSIVIMGDFVFKNIISQASAKSVIEENIIEPKQSENATTKHQEDFIDLENLSADIGNFYIANNITVKILLILATFGIFALMWQAMKRK